MKLTREQRAAIKNGEAIKLTYDAAEPCPYPVGYVKQLSKHVRLEVTAVYRTAPTPEFPKGQHSLGYTVHRSGARFLAKQQGQAHPEQYASSPAGAIDLEAGEAVDELTQKRITRAARDREREQVADLVQAAESVVQKLKERSEEDPSRKRMDWPVQREINRLLERERRKAA